MTVSGRETILQAARIGGIEWTQVGFVWPELDACYCQGGQRGAPCADLRLQQVEALFAREDASA